MKHFKEISPETIYSNEKNVDLNTVFISDLYGLFHKVGLVASESWWLDELDQYLDDSFLQSVTTKGQVSWEELESFLFSLIDSGETKENLRIINQKLSRLIWTRIKNTAIDNYYAKYLVTETEKVILANRILTKCEGNSEYSDENKDMDKSNDNENDRSEGDNNGGRNHEQEHVTEAKEKEDAAIGDLTARSAESKEASVADEVASMFFSGEALG